MAEHQFPVGRHLPVTAGEQFGQFIGGQEVAGLADDHQVPAVLLRRPLLRHGRLTHLGVGQVGQPAPGRADRGGAGIQAQEPLTAFGERGGQLPDGAPDFQGLAVAVPGQAGQQHLALAPFIAAGAVVPWVFALLVELFEDLWGVAARVRVGGGVAQDLGPVAEVGAERGAEQHLVPGLVGQRGHLGAVGGHGRGLGLLLRFAQL